MLDDFLLQVNKPARYIGEEWNVVKKDFDKANIRFALCFPDLYELGMSNLGIRIIYGLLNSLPDVVCERFFSCPADMENILRRNHMEIFSLESRRRLKEFDFIGFSLGYELNYTNVLNILDLGALPLKASLRDASLPLVIGGGPCVMNPEPLHEFFDFFIIGEAEEVILEVIDIYRKFKDKFKASKISKTELLIILSKIMGVYVPSLYDVAYTEEGKIDKFKAKFPDIPLKIQKRFIKNLDASYFPLDWLIPYMQVVHDRITFEIMRGCPNNCHFCQARSQYFPFRVREINNIFKLTSDIYKNTGYEEISLCGLSVSDHPDIGELLRKLISSFKEKAISISLPSIQPRAMVGELSSLISTVKKTGLTFAPEAATERLLKMLNKNFDINDFFKATAEAYRCGYRSIKLYFMIGLPSEKESDLDGIMELANRASQLRRSLAYLAPFNKAGTFSAAKINISINTLIPKPHTPFQWFGMEEIDTIKSKQAYLKKKRKNNKLKISFHDPYMSFLEGVLSRGDRRLSEVIISAFKKGAKFDSWSNYFIFDKWIKAFSETGINPNFYLREKRQEELLPWDFLDIGIGKETLIKEFKETKEEMCSSIF